MIRRTFGIATEEADLTVPSAPSAGHGHVHLPEYTGVHGEREGANFCAGAGAPHRGKRHYSVVWQDVADELTRLAELPHIPVAELQPQQRQLYAGENAAKELTRLPTVPAVHTPTCLFQVPATSA